MHIRHASTQPGAPPRRIPRADALLCVCVRASSSSRRFYRRSHQVLEKEIELFTKNLRTLAKLSTLTMVVAWQFFIMSFEREPGCATHSLTFEATSILPPSRGVRAFWLHPHATRRPRRWGRCRECEDAVSGGGEGRCVKSIAESAPSQSGRGADASTAVTALRLAATAFMPQSARTAKLQTSSMHHERSPSARGRAAARSLTRVAPSFLLLPPPPLPSRRPPHASRSGASCDDGEIKKNNCNGDWTADAEHHTTGVGAALPFSAAPARRRSLLVVWREERRACSFRAPSFISIARPLLCI